MRCHGGIVTKQLLLIVGSQRAVRVFARFSDYMLGVCPPSLAQRVYFASCHIFHRT